MLFFWKFHDIVRKETKIKFPRTLLWRMFVMDEDKQKLIPRENDKTETEILQINKILEF